MHQIDEYVDLLERKAGKRHKYQYIIFLVSFFSWGNYFYVLSSSPFFELLPVVNIKHKDTGITEDLRMTKELCSDPNIELIKKVIEPGYSLVTSFPDLYCNDLLTAIMNACVFGGVIVGMLLLSVCNELLGRKKTIMYSGIINFCIAIISTFTVETYQILIGIFLYNCTGMLLVQTCLLFTQELVVNSQRSLYSTAVGVGYIFCIVFYAGLFSIIENWKVGFYISAVYGAILMLVCHFFIMESSKTFLKRRQYDLFILNLLEVSVINNRKKKFLGFLLKNKENYFLEKFDDPTYEYRDRLNKLLDDEDIEFMNCLLEEIESNKNYYNENTLLSVHTGLRNEYLEKKKDNNYNNKEVTDNKDLSNNITNATHIQENSINRNKISNASRNKISDKISVKTIKPDINYQHIREYFKNTYKAEAYEEDIENNLDESDHDDSDFIEASIQQLEYRRNRKRSYSFSNDRKSKIIQYAKNQNITNDKNTINKEKFEDGKNKIIEDNVVEERKRYLTSANTNNNPILVEEENNEDNDSINLDFNNEVNDQRNMEEKLLQYEANIKTSYKTNKTTKTAKTSKTNKSKRTKNDNKPHKYSNADLIVFKSQRLKFLFLCFIWFSVCGMYFGNTVNLKNLKGSIFKNVFINGAVEFSALLVSGNIMNTHILGRKYSVLFNSVIATLGYFIITFVPLSDTFELIMPFLCKFVLAQNLNILFVISGESYPNTIKNFGYSLNTSLGKVGALTLTFVMEILTSFSANLLFSILALLTFVMIIFIKETRGKPLVAEIPELIEKDIDKNRSLIEN